MTAPDLPPTAFPATARYLRATCADAALDAASFDVPLRPCALARCAGTCCAVGVTLNPEEALVIAQLARRHAVALAELLPDLPPSPIVTEADGVTHTATKPRAMRQLVAVGDAGNQGEGAAYRYPAHFPDTACAFLTADARCALQTLALDAGQHPWAWKPLACWLHPIAVSGERIALPSPASDPHPGGFASATPCGRRVAATVPGARPAREVLRAELAHLGHWLGRDLVAELAAAGDVV